MNDVTKDIAKILKEEIDKIYKFVPDVPAKQEAIRKIYEGILWLKEIP